MLTDALDSSLSMSSLINKANTIVKPTSAAVSYAIMDQGGSLNSNYGAVVSTFATFFIVHVSYYIEYDLLSRFFNVLA